MSVGCDCPQLIKINKIHTFFKADFKSDYVFGGERHNYWEMVFVINGSVGITADSNVYILQKGQAVLHRPNEFHKIWTESSGVPTVIIISFSADIFPESQQKVINLHLSELEEIQKLYDDSSECFERKNINVSSPCSEKFILLQKFWLRLENLLFSIITKTDLNDKSFSKMKGLKSAEIYSAAVKYMEKNPGEGYCVNDIAAEFSISAAYLKKIFLKYSGCGVMQYYNRLKARIACSYLDSGKSVKETANLLGFSDQNYFSVFFKRITGKTPSQYRSRNIQ